jgi:protein-S-isoprenylcysteine O-methyltransferase Ste14
MGAALFLIAGSLAVPSIWLYLGLRELFTAASVLAMSEEVARERLKPGRGSRREPLYTIGAGVLWIVHFIVAALDLGRIGWSAGFPLWLQGLGVAGTLGAYGLVIWALRHNEYLSARIRIQSDRGHRVADTGPYAYIRHPNYAGAALMGLTSGLVFGSWPSVLPILLWIGLLVYRTLMEERVLHAGLEGYTEYTKRVCWRFLPGVW